MRRVNSVSNPDLVELTSVLRDASRIEDPSQMLARYGAWFGRKRPADHYLSVSRRGLPDGKFKITRSFDRLHSARPERLLVNPWRDWDRLPTFEGGFIGQVIASDEPQLLRGLDLRDDPVLGDGLRGMGSCMALPNYDDGLALNWSFFFLKDPEGWSLEQVESTLLDGNLLGVATRHLVTRQQVMELNTKLRDQLEQVANIQQSLLPERLPRIPGLRIATSYLTSDEAGGDYYDFFPFPDGTWGLLIADVAGHGAAAATVMAMLRAILHCYDGGEFSPARVMSFANEKLIASRLHGSFVTAFLAQYEPVSGRVRWARCGHNPPRLKPGDGAPVLALEEPGALPLGVSRTIDVREGDLTLRPLDTLVLYTDGITEAFGPAESPSFPGLNGVRDRYEQGRREMFGVERLDHALAECSGEPECVVDSVHAALFRHTGVMSRDDDQTLVVLRRAEDGGA